MNNGRFDSIVDTVTITATPRPIANAGEASYVRVDGEISLDGSASANNAGNSENLTYQWVLLSSPSGSVAILENGTSVSPSFTPDIYGVYVFQLIINDGSFDSTPSTVTITVGNMQPVANAGDDRVVEINTLVYLNGSAYDADPADVDSLTYRWAFALKDDDTPNIAPSSHAELLNTNTATPSFIVDEPGAYFVDLIVSDGKEESVVDTVKVTATIPIVDGAQLTGFYLGDFQFIANAHVDNQPGNPPTYMGKAIKRINWEWDFNNLEARFRFDQGDLFYILADTTVGAQYIEDPDSHQPSDGGRYINGYRLSIGTDAYPVPITVTGMVPLTYDGGTDDGGTLYTGKIDFQVFNPLFAHPRATLEITWKVVKDGNELTITTIDGDGNGFPGTVMGDADSNPPWAGFPFPFEPTWNGVARLDAVDSNGNGLLDSPSLGLNLDPDITDNDGDGISDIDELGAGFMSNDFSSLFLQEGRLTFAEFIELDGYVHPLDSDNDGVYDVFEPGDTNHNSSLANGLRFIGKDEQHAEEVLALNLSVESGTIIKHLSATELLPSSGGAIDYGPGGIKFAFDDTPGAEVNFDSGPMFAIRVSANASDKVTARLQFLSVVSLSATPEAQSLAKSSPLVESSIAKLPEKILLYRIATTNHGSSKTYNGISYHLQPKDSWTKIDDYTLDLHLEDGGEIDEDGIKNGEITTRFVVASNNRGDYHVEPKNGGAMNGILLILLLFLVSAKAMAEKKTSPEKSKSSPEQLQDIEVKAEPESVQRVDMEFELLEVPGGTNMIDLDKKDSSQSTLFSILDFEPGVIMQEFFGGNDQPRLNIRGSGIQDNPVSRGVQLLYDGLPLNQADGSFIIGLLDPEQAMLVSVFRGANGMQYGASTLGGAINFVQRNGGNSGSTLRLEAGSQNSFNGSVSTGGREGNWDYYMIGGHDRSDGYRNHSSGERSNLMLNVGYQHKNIENRTYFHLTDNSFEIPFVLPKDRATEYPKLVLGELDEPVDVYFNVFQRDPYRDTQQYRLANKTTIWGENSEQSVGFYADKVDDVFRNPITSVETKAKNYGVEYRYKIFVEDKPEMVSDNYQFSLSANYGDMPRKYFPISRVGEKMARTDYLDLEAKNLAAGVQAMNNITSALQLVSSIQWVANERSIKDRQIPGLLDSEFSYQTLNPKIGLVYNLNDHNRFFTNISHSSEAPTFWQLVINRASPVHTNQVVFINPLESQEADTFEIGTVGKWQSFEWQFNYYYSWIQDELISEIDDDYGVNGRTVNYSDETTHEGVELLLSTDVFDDLMLDNDNLAVKTVYNYADYKFKGGRFDGLDIAGVPKHLVHAEAKYSFGDGYSITPNVRWQPEDAFADHVNSAIQDAYTLWGLKLAYKSKDDLLIFASFDNLTEEVYQTSYVIHGSARDDNGGLVPAFIPGGGFNFSAGIVLKW